jgi:hypothetical protein
MEDNTNYEQLKNAGVITSEYDASHVEACASLDQSEVDSLIRIVGKLDDAHRDDAPSKVGII